MEASRWVGKNIYADSSDIQTVKGKPNASNPSTSRKTSVLPLIMVRPSRRAINPFIAFYESVFVFVWLNLQGSFRQVLYDEIAK